MSGGVFNPPKDSTEHAKDPGRAGMGDMPAPRSSGDKTQAQTPQRVGGPKVRGI